MPSYESLDGELLRLNLLLGRMMDRVVDQLTRAIEAVVNHDPEMAKRVRLGDDEIDDLEIKVDRQCEVLMASLSAVALDVRMIVTAIKVNTDLERIGDHSANIAKFVPSLSDLSSSVLKEARTVKLAKHARAILQKTRRAFLEQSKEDARAILPLDKEVDRLYKQAIAKIVDLGKANPELSKGLAYLLLVTKALERICDHAMNIAELIIFQVDGVDVRHIRLLPPVVRVHDLIIDSNRFVVERWTGGKLKRLQLPRKQFRLLHFLSAHAGRAFSRDDLLAAVWEDEVEVVPRTVDVHVRRLRMSIGEGLIETVTGIGYRFKEG